MLLNHPQLEIAANYLYSVCFQYSKNPARGSTVVFYGSNGTGKSSILTSAQRWARNNAMRFPFVFERLTEQRNLALPNSMFVEWGRIVKGFKEQEYKIMEDMEACSMLCLDDIGAEHDPSKFGSEELYLLLSRREFRWNLISTNVVPELWEEKFERRIASRLFRNAVHVDMSQVPDFSTT